MVGRRGKFGQGQPSAIKVYGKRSLDIGRDPPAFLEGIVQEQGASGSGVKSLVQRFGQGRSGVAALDRDKQTVEPPGMVAVGYAIKVVGKHTPHRRAYPRAVAKSFPGIARLLVTLLGSRSLAVKAALAFGIFSRVGFGILLGSPFS